MKVELTHMQEAKSRRLNSIHMAFQIILKLKEKRNWEALVRRFVLSMGSNRFNEIYPHLASIKVKSIKPIFQPLNTGLLQLLLHILGIAT